MSGTPHAAHVIGAQANLWSEVTENRARVDYQVFPRLAAFAEAAWSTLPHPDERDFADFDRRMREAHYGRLEAMSFAYRPPHRPTPLATTPRRPRPNAPQTPPPLAHGLSPRPLPLPSKRCPGGSVRTSPPWYRNGRTPPATAVPGVE